MSSDQYIIAFEFDEIVQNVSDLQESYALLTEELSKSASASSDLVDRVGTKLDSAATKLTSSMQTMNTFYTNLVTKFTGLVATFKDLDKYSKSITDNMKGLQGVDLSGMKATDATAMQRIEAVSPSSSGAGGGGESSALIIAKDALSMAKSALEAATGAHAAADAAAKAAKTSVSTSKAAMAIKGVAKKAGGAVGLKSMGGGGLLGAAMSLMVLGVEWEQRQHAERGQMQNAAEAGGGLYKKGVQRGISQLAKFGEHAQFQFGITIGEIQKVVKQVANMGIEINSKLTGTSNNFKNVNANAITMTLAVDKHLKLSTGSTMQNAISLMEGYGYSLNDAATKMRDLSLAAKGSGMDVNKFIGTIMDGSSALVQYQIDAEDVAVVMLNIQSHYKDMGLNSQRSGSMASKVTGDLVSGLSSMNRGLRQWVAQELGYGKTGKGDVDPVLAEQQMQSRYLEQKSSKDKENFMVLAWGKVVDKYIGSTKTKSQAQDQLDREARLGSDAARYLVSKSFAELLASVRSGGGGVSVDPKDRKEYRKTFKRSGATLTDLYKATKDITENLAKIGQGAVKILSGIYGILVVGVKGIFALLSALGIEDTDVREKIMGQMGQLFGAQVDTMVDGVSDMYKGMTGVLGNVADFMGDTMKNIKKLHAWNPSEGLLSIRQQVIDLEFRFISGLHYLDYEVAKVRELFYSMRHNLIEFVGAQNTEFGKEARAARIANLKWGLKGAETSIAMQQDAAAIRAARVKKRKEAKSKKNGNPEIMVFTEQEIYAEDLKASGKRIAEGSL